MTIQTAPATSQFAGLGAAELAASAVEVMDTLTAVLTQETTLVRAGRLREAEPLERAKADLAQRYVAIATRMKAIQRDMAQAAPQLIDTVRERHKALQGLLQGNLTVLATAHAVSEGIMRGVAGELARKAAPQTYGATGRPTAPRPNAAQPLTVSRVL